MWNPRMPKKVRFPGGFVLEIKVAARPTKFLEEDSDAEYHTVETDQGLIVLWEGLTPRQRWLRLMHEMIHAVVDAQRLVEIRTKT